MSGTYNRCKSMLEEQISVVTAHQEEKMKRLRAAVGGFIVTPLASVTSKLSGQT